MYTIEEKTFLLKEKVLIFFFVFQIVVKHSYVKFVLTTQKLYVASVFPLLFFVLPNMNRVRLHALLLHLFSLLLYIPVTTC